MKQLRIALVSHAYPYLAGNHAGQFVHELASALVELGHRVYAVIPEPPEASHIREMDGVQLEFYSVRDKVSYGRSNDSYTRVPRPAVAFSLIQASLKLHQVVHQRGIDIIHAHWTVPMGFVAGLIKAITGCPLVITTHGRDVYVNPQAGAMVAQLWYAKPFLRFALRHADRIIAVSHDCARHAVNAGAPQERVTVIYNGVSLQRFAPSDIDTARIRKQHGLDEANKVILTVGSLRSYKGIDILLKSMPGVLEAIPSAAMLVIGDGTEREALLALRDSLGLQEHVIFAGHIPNVDLAPYENMCDVFVMPSRRESFGIAAIEAMACAKPVIGARVGGLQEIIDNSQTGLLVEPDNIEQLRAAIIQVLQQEEWAKRLGQNAHLKVKSAFSWSGVARKTEALYKGLLPADET